MACSHVWPDVARCSHILVCNQLIAISAFERLALGEEVCDAFTKTFHARFETGEALMDGDYLIVESLSVVFDGDGEVVYRVDYVEWVGHCA